jgi:hypothetical protein
MEKSAGNRRSIDLSHYLHSQQDPGMIRKHQYKELYGRGA